MADMIPQGVQREGFHGGYERTDANLKAVVIAMVIILSVVVVAILASLVITYSLRAREAAKDVPRSQVAVREVPPEPRLLPSPITARDNMLPWERGAVEYSEQRVAADRYSYTDKARGVVTIPVDRAMELVAKENLPARQPTGRIDLAGETNKGNTPVADADYDGSMTSDSTGGRKLDSDTTHVPSFAATGSQGNS